MTALIKAHPVHLPAIKRCRS